MKKLSFIIVFFIVMAGAIVCAHAESVTESIDAENTFTDSIAPANEDYNKDKNRADLGFINIGVSGTGWSATVTLQKKCPEDAGWGRTVATFTANIETTAIDYEPGVLYRIGVATGDYGFGTVDVRLGN